MVAAGERDDGEIEQMANEPSTPVGGQDQSGDVVDEKYSPGGPDDELQSGFSSPLGLGQDPDGVRAEEDDGDRGQGPLRA